MSETGVKLLWGTANLFSHPRYAAGAATNPDPAVFVHAAAQVRAAIDRANYRPFEGRRRIIGMSVREPGVVRFDVIQQEDDPTRFVLVEVYRGPDDPARHKETAHYAAWRDAAESMMAEPRRSVKYRALFPERDAWEMPR